MTNQFEHYQSHPPRCIEPYATQPFGLEPVSFDGHGDDSVNVGFSLACKCGSHHHLLSGLTWRSSEDADPAIIGPITTECVKCKTGHVLFDTDKHGYDAELGHGSSYASSEGTLGTLECQNHPEREMEILVRFEYPTDLFGEDFAE